MVGTFARSFALALLIPILSCAAAHALPARSVAITGDQTAIEQVRSSKSKGGDVYVHGYTRKDGTKVQPHMRSAPNGSKSDNWSTKGNVNPYTGKPGTKDPYAGVSSSPSRSPSYAPPP